MDALDGRSDHVRVLYRQTLVVEEHVDGRRDLLRRALIYLWGLDVVGSDYRPGVAVPGGPGPDASLRLRENDFRTRSGPPQFPIAAVPKTKERTLVATTAHVAACAEVSPGTGSPTLRQKAAKRGSSLKRRMKGSKRRDLIPGSRSVHARSSHLKVAFASPRSA